MKQWWWDSIDETKERWWNSIDETKQWCWDSIDKTMHHNQWWGILVDKVICT